MKEVRKTLTQRALQEIVDVVKELPEQPAAVREAVSTLEQQGDAYHRLDHPHFTEAKALQTLVSAADEAGAKFSRGFWCRESLQALIKSPQVQRPSARECRGMVETLPARTDGAQFKDPDGKTTFAWTQTAFPLPHFSPTHSRFLTSLRVTTQLFDPLLTMGAGDGPPGPAAAQSYSVSDDGRVYTFHLNPEAKWSDGTAVVAQDFVRAFERTLDATAKSPSGERLYYIENAEAYLKNDIDDFSQVGVRAADPHTLEIRLRHANDQFPYIVTDTVYSPIPPIADEKPQDWIKPEHMVSSGPYRLTKYKHDQVIEMEKNVHHPDADDVAFERIRIFVNHSEKAAEDWYASGKVDWTGGKLLASSAQTFIREGRDDYHAMPVVCTEYLAMNTQQPPFDDVRIRRAFNMVIDKARITRQVLGAGQRAVTHFVPDVFREDLGFRPPRGDGYDVEAAKQLLIAGVCKVEPGVWGALSAANRCFAGMEAFAGLTYEFDSRESHRMIAEALQRQIKDVFGLDLQLYNQEKKTLITKMQNGETRLARHRWCPDYYGPEGFFKPLSSDYGYNFSQYNNPEYDALKAELDMATTQKERNAISVRLHQHINTYVPIAPMFQLVENFLLRPGIHGFEPQYQGNHMVRYMWY